MKCEEYQDQLLNLSLGEDVSDDVIGQMIEHVFECDECLRYFRALKFFDAQMKHRVEVIKKSKDAEKLSLKAKTKVLVDGKETDFEIAGNKIRLVLFRKPGLEDKNITVVFNDKEVFKEQFSSSDDYLMDAAADTGPDVIDQKEEIVLSERIDSQGMKYKVMFDSKKKVSFLVIDFQ